MLSSEMSRELNFCLYSLWPDAPSKSQLQTKVEESLCPCASSAAFCDCAFLLFNGPYTCMIKKENPAKVDFTVSQIAFSFGFPNMVVWWIDVYVVCTRENLKFW